MADGERPPTGSRLDASFRLVRSSLANLRAAAETLDAFPELEVVRRSRLLRVLVDESQRLSHAVVALEAELRSRGGHPRLATVEETLAATTDALAAAGVAVESAAEPGTRADAVVSTPLPELTAGIGELVRGLRRELGVATLRLSHGELESFLRLDLAWPLGEGEELRATAWVPDAIAGTGTGGAGSGLRALLREHGGEVWFTLERDGSAAHVRLLLPLFQNDPATS